MCPRTWTRPFLAALALVLALSGESQAAPIQGLFDTGVDDAGVVQANGSSELHYVMTGPVSPAIVAAPNPSWLSPPTGSAWIGPTSGTTTDPVGTYSYTLTFDLAGLDATTASISGQWATDNTASIYLNGVDTGLQKDSFRQLDPFEVSSGFVAGVNTLEFRVSNPDLSGLNPTGLLVAELSGTAVPEPSTATLTALGLAALANRRHRRHL